MLAGGGAWAGLLFVAPDLVLAALFGLLASALPRLARPVYAALALYTALNVPVASVLSTPLTWPLMQAAGGALGGSIASFLDLRTVSLCAAVLLVAGLALGLRSVRAAAVLAVALLVGAGASTVVDPPRTGYHRNAVAALVSSLIEPRLGAGASWDPGLLDAGGEGPDLRHLRASAQRHSVALVVLESTGAPYLGLFGAHPDPMPSLAAFASQGLVFENVSAAYPESIKGLFSLLCATWPAVSTPPQAYARDALDRTSVAEALSSAGYRTALFHSGRFGYLGMRHIVSERGFDVLRDAGTIASAASTSFGVDELSTVREALGFIDGLEPGEPFFLVYLPIAGHHPYVVHGDLELPFEEEDDFDRYRNSLFYADAAVRTLREGLEARGRGADTLWVFLGDHGEAFHQHEGNFAHTLHLYQENIHVPLAFVGEGVLPALRISRPASLIDVAPTLLDLLGVPVPPSCDGRSLLEPTARIPLFLTDYGARLLGLRDGRWKAILDLDSARLELFDLVQDPGERKNLASSHEERTARYAALLRSWAAHQRDAVLGSPAASFRPRR